MVQRLKPSSAALSLTKSMSKVSSKSPPEPKSGLGWSTRVRRTEARVIPLEGRRREPLGFACVSGVFDDDAHAVMAVVIGGVAHDPDAGMIHLDDGGDALGGAEPEHGDCRGIGHGVAVECDDLELVAGKREAANFGGAAVEDVEQHALAWL